MNEKMLICMANGCISFWVVDPKGKSVSVTEGDLTRHYRSSGAIFCRILSGQIQVQEIFQ